MDELIKTFHIEAGMLLAQGVNFLIVLFVLYKFAYGPILKALNERTAKIEKGVKDAEETQKRLQEITQNEKEVMAKARQEAQAILVQAQDSAKNNRAEILAEAKLSAEKMIETAKKQLEQDKEKMMAELKGEVAGLVVAATEKILAQKIDAEKDKELINKILG